MLVAFGAVVQGLEVGERVASRAPGSFGVGLVVTERGRGSFELTDLLLLLGRHLDSGRGFSSWVSVWVWFDGARAAAGPTHDEGLSRGSRSGKAGSGREGDFVLDVHFAKAGEGVSILCVLLCCVVCASLCRTRSSPHPTAHCPLYTTHCRSRDCQGSSSLIVSTREPGAELAPGERAPFVVGLDLSDQPGRRWEWSHHKSTILLASTKLRPP